MSAIGDYVHFLTKNYVKYGTKKFGQGADFNVTGFEAYKAQRIGKINPISESSISQLEMRLKENSPLQENIDKQLVNTEIQKRIDYVYEILKDTVSTAALSTFLKGNKATPSNKNIEGIVKTDIELKNMQQQAQEIRRLLKYFLDNQTMTQETFEAKSKQLEQLCSEFFNTNITIGDFQSYRNKSIKSVLGKLQEEINNYNFNTTQSAIRGDFGELLVATCADHINGLSEKQALETIKNLVKGAQRSNIEISSQTLEGLDLSHLDFLKNITIDSGTLSIGSTQDKVDVQIKVKDEDVFASVKNYNLNWEGLKKYGVHLQQQNLIYVLISMIDSGYANHWINLHAANINPVKVSDGFVSDVDNAVRFELIYDAFVKGNPLKSGTQAANVFVLMDSKTGKLKVVNAAQVLMDDALRAKSFKLGHGDKITNPRLSNIKDPRDSSYRIEDILNQIHKIKIAVSYNVDDF